MWTLEYSRTFIKQAKQLDRAVLQRISDYLDGVVASQDPYSRGKPLVGNRSGFWRYRVGDYRILARIYDSAFIVVAVEVGHRKEVYR
jgi:mRNA interferase RelE/StbE